MGKLSNSIKAWIQKESLPNAYFKMSEKYFFPVAERIYNQYTSRSNQRIPWVVGINGSQGSGKSTLSSFLQIVLSHKYGLNCIVLSIDDLYKTKLSRQQLGQKVHPLLKTRGVPGTHDMELAFRVFKDVLESNSESIIRIPRFDKSQDDRLTEDRWELYKGKVDVLLFEGWCVGTNPQKDSELNLPVNEFERKEDPDRTWRCYVNSALETEYKQLFSYINQLIMLKAPNFDCVYKWRRLQERKLRNRPSDGNSSDSIMSDAEVLRFIQHYERLTLNNLHELPRQCDCVMFLNDNHEVYKSITRETGSTM